MYTYKDNVYEMDSQMLIHLIGKFSKRESSGDDLIAIPSLETRNIGLFNFYSLPISHGVRCF